MSDLETIRAELRDLGIESRIVEFPEFSLDKAAVMFGFTAPSGKHKGRPFNVGVSFKETGYPEYPPHFIHVCGEKLLGETPYETHTQGGKTWYAYSRPPIDAWDTGSHPKTMRTFVNVHMRRLWHNA